MNTLIDQLKEVNHKYNSMTVNIVFGKFNGPYGIYKINRDIFDDLQQQIEKNPEFDHNKIKIKRYQYKMMEMQINHFGTSYIKKQPLSEYSNNNYILTILNVVKIDKEEFPLISEYHNKYEESIDVFKYKSMVISFIEEFTDSKKKINSIRISFHLDNNFEDNIIMLENVLKIFNKSFGN